MPAVISPVSSRGKHQRRTMQGFPQKNDPFKSCFGTTRMLQILR